MNRSTLAATALFALLGAAASAHAQESPRPAQPTPATAATPPSAAHAETPTQIAVRLADHRVEVREVAFAGSSVKWGRATGLVDARTDLVLRIVQDYGKYSEFLPNFEASRVLSQRGAAAVVYLEASVLHGAATLWAQMRMRPRAPVVNADGTTTQIVEATMISGNVERMAARWELTSVDAGTRTLVSFQFIVEPDLPFPASVMTGQNVAAARRTIGRLRARLNEPRFAVAAR
jgi:ribosome-associated toxin RatA of RatAB toxin-antitoxin module